MSAPTGTTGAPVVFPIRQVTEDWLRSEPTSMIFATNLPRPWIDEFGPRRIRTFPIAENAMVSMAVGAAMAGSPVLVLIARAAFLYAAADAVVNQAALAAFVSGGQLTVPLTIRAPTRGDEHLGPQHEHLPWGHFAASPGLEVMVPGCLYEATTALGAALRSPRPTLLFEGVRIFDEPWSSASAAVGRAHAGLRRLHHGTRMTIVVIGALQAETREALLRTRPAVDADVYSLSTLSRLPVDEVAASCARTGRLLVVEEAPRRCGVGDHLLVAVQRLAPGVQGAVLAAPDAPMSFALALREHLRPSAATICDAVTELLRDDACLAIRSGHSSRSHLSPP